MKIFTIMLPTILTLIIGIGLTSCSKNGASEVTEELEKTNETPSTLAEKFKGSYTCTINTSKPHEKTIYPADKLILFLTPTDDKDPNKLNIEVRMWVSSIMFHDLTFKVPMILTEQANNTIKGKIEGKVIQYAVMGLKGIDKGNATLELSMNEKGIPKLKSVVILDGTYDYKMEFDGIRRSSKLLPGAVSTL